MPNLSGRCSAAALLLALSTLDVLAATSHSAFTHYPGFVRHRATVEAATDKGLTVELIVRCPSGTGIVHYSKVDDVYCGPDHRCHSALDRAVKRLCR